MKIAVLVKRVPDTASVFKIAPDGKSIVEDGLKFVMSPYDEHAVEEAIKIKEANGAEVVVISLGPEGCKEVLRTALAIELHGLFQVGVCNRPPIGPAHQRGKDAFGYRTEFVNLVRLAKSLSGGTQPKPVPMQE